MEHLTANDFASRTMEQGQARRPEGTFKLKEIRAIRVRLQLSGHTRHLPLFEPTWPTSCTSMASGRRQVSTRSFHVSFPDNFFCAVAGLAYAPATRSIFRLLAERGFWKGAENGSRGAQRTRAPSRTNRAGVSLL
jgi:hypothetical protein